MVEDDTIPRLKALIGEHGFAVLEAFNEQFRKNPPSKERMNKAIKMMMRRKTIPSLEEMKKELWGDNEVGA